MKYRLNYTIITKQTAGLTLASLGAYFISWAHWLFTYQLACYSCCSRDNVGDISVVLHLGSLLVQVMLHYAIIALCN